MSALITKPVSVPAGLIDTIEVKGHFVTIEPDGWLVDDSVAVQNIVNTYVGSADELTWHKQQKQALLDAQLDNNFDLKAFIRAGTSTTVTAAGVGSFLSTIVDNYRSIRASITAATTVTAVDAISVTSGWPSNP